MTTRKFFKAVVITGLIAGSLDAAAASIQYYINTGNNPARVFRYIASAVFKEKTKTGSLYGWAALGLVFHFLIAMSFTLLFFLCFRQIRMLLKNKFVAGIVYGIFVWCVMNLLVVPLAFGVDFGVQYQKYFDNIKNSLIAMGILIIAIGLPISLLADRYYSKKNSY